MEPRQYGVVGSRVGGADASFGTCGAGRSRSARLPGEIAT